MKFGQPPDFADGSAIPGAVFSGSNDGHLRAYATADGKVIWDYDTARDFKTVNGIPGHGGAMDVGGPIVADRTFYFTNFERRELNQSGLITIDLTPLKVQLQSMQRSP